MLVPNSSIEQVWEIMQDPRSEEFPFLVVCTLGSGKKMGFQCRTIDEAHAKINAIAEVLFGKQNMAVA